MDILKAVYERAKENKQSVAFPEAENEKIMQAAYETAAEGYVKSVLVGNVEKLKALCRERGYDESVFNFVDNEDAELQERLIEKYKQLPNTILGPKSLARRMSDPMYCALIMQAVGEVDVTFAGMDHTTGEVILAGQTIVGLADGISTVSSIGIANIPGFEGADGSILAFGDSAVCQNPNARQLADIAISACETFSGVLGIEPRCALVCYSTLGSGSGELLDKVIEAVKLANADRPDLKIEGEFQLDAAIVPAVAAKKVKTPSAVAGKANLVIWPDLNVGNVAVKLIQQFGHADAYGPMLQGFKKIVCDCSRGAPVSELKGNIVISAVRSIALKKSEVR